MLTGSELIAKTKELKGVSESERVLACGYFSTSKNGKKRKNYNAYYKAIAEAQGYKSGNLLIGKAYTALLDLKAGDNFEIKIGKKGKAIRLLPTEE